MQDSKHTTKTKIFDAALRLFAAQGVENVSMRDIADAVGIKAASIYNHYSSKEQIVEMCYDFFLDNHDITRMSVEQQRYILINGTKEEIILVPVEKIPEEMEDNFIYAMSILFSRIYTDSLAIQKYTEMIDRSLQFLKSFFELGIETGRFSPFPVMEVAILFLSIRLFFAQSTTIHPVSLHDSDWTHERLILELINNIPFNY